MKSRAWIENRIADLELERSEIAKANMPAANIELVIALLTGSIEALTEVLREDEAGKPFKSLDAYEAKYQLLEGRPRPAVRRRAEEK